ncbi:MAG TPA: YjjG family noncanonical pyrimidine nucleotidase [Candidatus Lachnoclostridium avicola]|nr:YjjG family noncanonical pyrimidine nucleotidase [Candidatus Lachnoclostridium avicola]
MKMKALLIDIDGTLLDYRQSEALGISAIMEHYGVTPTPELAAHYHDVNQSFWEKYEKGEITRAQINEGRYPAFFGELGVEVDPEVCEEIYQNFVNNRLVPVEGAEDMLRYLSGKYLLYAASNGYSDKQRERLRKAGMIFYFTDIFVSQETGSQKPQKEFFDYCFARMPAGLKRDEVMIIGDGLTSDMRGGNNAGIHTCWLNAYGEVNHAGVSIDVEIHSLAEIRNFL